MSERPDKPERLPHENLLSTSRSTLYGALDRLPRPEQMTLEQLEHLKDMAADMMTVLVKLGETAKQERERIDKN